MIAQGRRIIGFEHGVCRKTVPDPVNLRIGEDTAFFSRVCDDPLTLEGDFLPVIYSRGIPKHHFERNSKKKEKQSKQREKMKGRIPG